MQEIKMIHLVLSANTYDMPATDSEGNRLDSEPNICGVSIWYYDQLDFELSSGKEDRADNSFIERGSKPAKFSIPLDLSHKINQVPGVYEVIYGSKSRQGRNSFVPVDLNYIGPAQPYFKGNK